MKRASIYIIMEAILMMAVTAWGAPFHTQYVCVPTIDLNDTSLEFKIREDSSCGKDESFMQVQNGPDGSTLLIPSQTPLSPEVKSDLERYRKYMGLD